MVYQDSRELETDPPLQNENWGRFLPKIKKKNVKQNKVKRKEKKPYAIVPLKQQPTKASFVLKCLLFFSDDSSKVAPNMPQNFEDKCKL
ncbi:KRR1 small subunit processome component homolog isoform X2 [Ricinus communis]|uniref:KRR1 small subunit processome component homolog isoform X2 n=1 Tax=Ricinus communis TaxID=3988 RepID=UPI00201A7FBE|nr:KRR1 small subunit processome component homolog isoform X2 [Ricinus communis]